MSISNMITALIHKFTCYKEDKFWYMMEKKFPFLVIKSISIRTWSIEHVGDASRVLWVFNEIIKYVDEHDDLKPMKIYAADKYGTDILLDDIQILILKPVLVSFFGEEVFDAVAEYIKRINESARDYRKVFLDLMMMTRSELLKYREDWGSIPADIVSERLKTDDAIQQYRELQANMIRLADYVLKKRIYKDA